MPLEDGFEDTPNQELTAEDIFAADDLTIRPYAVKEWKKAGKPGVLYFKVMSADESINFQEQLKTEKVKKDVIVRLMAACACDSRGNLLFTPAMMEKLKKKSTAVFLGMQKFILELNGMMLPEKNWKVVKRILTECGVEGDVVAQVQAKWEADDVASTEGLVKND